ncbi:MAG TPA: class IV adenylate cyclase [Treponemataceae bacterium]|nr:class IV adenylate cyclase [Treponemataceae bacterium]HOQ92564.1 class IV adenylate cyclase [Treponemataceae bacterium]HPM05718.1 class IV adenylate cyclase [Treponemataceae bacterium]
MFEIELKASLTNRKEVEEKISQFAEYLGKTEKSDVYWTQSRVGHPQKVRLREETNKPLRVNYKKKEIRSGQIEVNDEYEFTIGAGLDKKEAEKEKLSFETFLSSAGFSPSMVKHKDTKRWNFEDTLIEVSYVDKLGDFIEIEILSETADTERTIEAHKKLLRTLEKAGVPEENIETRYYSELLENV